MAPFRIEPELSGKWLEILKEVAPEVRRVAFLHHPQTAAHIGFLRAIEAASNSIGVTVRAADKFRQSLAAEVALWKPVVEKLALKID
jgi:hypothetical protein